MVHCMDPVLNVTSDGLLDQRLPGEVRDLLRRIGALLATQGMPAYLVGGSVRDAWLALPFQGDVDITVVGHGIAAARDVAAALGGDWLAQSPFGTATVRLHGLHVDFVTARSERYPSPGALPEVQPGTLTDDLVRRDFTVNALAVSIGPDSWGALADPHGGRADLESGLIRVLHAGSFRDDPTRMVRAVRYATRLGFRIEARTAQLMAEALLGLSSLSAARRWHELQRCLREPRPDLLLVALNQVGLLQPLHPDLAYTPAASVRFERYRRRRYEEMLSPESWLALLCWDALDSMLERIIEGLQLPGSYRETLRAIVALREVDGAGRGSQVLSALLPRVPVAALHAARYALVDPTDRAAIRTLLALWRFVSPGLRGDELLALGVPKGPDVGRYLEALRASRVQEVAKTVDDERWLVRDWLAGGGPPSG